MESFRRRSSVYWVAIMLPLVLLFQQPVLCSALSEDGKALLRIKELVEVDPFGSLVNWVAGEGEETTPCSWLGVGCHNGIVVSLNLEDFCLKGTLSHETGKLSHLRYLSLRNNSFYGLIPKEIGELQKLEVLNLGYNNFLGSLPSVIVNLLSLEVLVLDRNQILTNLSPELIKSNVLSLIQVDDDLFSSNAKSITRNVGNATIRRLLKVNGKADAPKAAPMYIDRPKFPYSPRPSAKGPSRPEPRVEPSPPPVIAPNESSPPATTPSSPPTGKSVSSTSRSASPLIFILISVGVGVLLIAIILAFYIRAKKIATVKPWATGLSGQLQKAFVTGVPILKLSEIQTACEDFSNVIGNSEDFTIYKGTLSSGVEIAVTSVVAKSSDWSKNSEAQFRKKIATLSKINHKNFVNLLGYCAEEKPFARMMVFEYAPNGTLYDHLHINEAKDLGWSARLRIAMGIAYCLEYMHQLDPPVVLEKLDSNSILLTDDYAAKIPDFGLRSKATAAEAVSRNSGLLVNQTLELKMVVYKFGLLLLEMISGRHSCFEKPWELVSWASDYLNGEKPVKDMVDPMLDGLLDEDVAGICSVASSCLNPDPNQRPSMKDVSTRLREITSLHPEGATPKISPLWWAELEIISTEVS